MFLCRPTPSVAPHLQSKGVSDLSTLSTLVPQVNIDRTSSGNGAIINIRGIGLASVDGSIE